MSQATGIQRCRRSRRPLLPWARRLVTNSTLDLVLDPGVQNGPANCYYFDREPVIFPAAAVVPIRYKACGLCCGRRPPAYRNMDGFSSIAGFQNQCFPLRHAGRWPGSPPTKDWTALTIMVLVSAWRWSLLAGPKLQLLLENRKKKRMWTHADNFC